MKIKFLLSLFVAGTLAVGAQTQGYKDGIEYYKAGQHDNARTILERTINDPATDRSLANYYLGQVALVQGDKAQARTYFDAGLAADAECPFNYVGLGALALQEGNDEAAKEQFKQAQKFGKKNAEVSVSIARAYYNADPVKYDRDITKALEKARKDSKNADPSIYVLEGDMLAAAENFGDAAARYEMAITYDPNNPEGYVKFANAYFNVNKDFGINKLQEFLNAHPESAMAQRELAEKLFLADRWKAASELYGKYIQNPNHFQGDEQRYSGLLYFGKKYQESLDVANQVLAKDPNNEYMQRMVMLNKAALKDFTGAEEAAKKLFSHADAKFTATDYTTYGDILGELKRPEDAVAAYTKAYELNPEKNKQILANISSMYTDLEDYQKAAEYMQKFVDAGDASLNDYFILSNRYKNLGVSLPEGSPERIEAANNGIKYVDMAIESAANKGPLYRNKATLMMVRDGAEITPALVETYQQMLAAYDENPENKEKYRDAYKSAYNNLANYYLKAGDKEQARAYFEKFLEIDPENEALREYLNKM